MNPERWRRYGGTPIIVVLVPGKHLALHGTPEHSDPGDQPAEQTVDPVVEFYNAVTTWTQQQIQHWQRQIDATRAEYARRDWRFTEEAVRHFRAQITLLTDAHATIDFELGQIYTLGARGLTLANIVYNEAGTYSDAARLAVAYAWLNRTGGAVREPTGQEISHYAPLMTRWGNLNDTARTEFVQRFDASLRAARQRLLAPNPAQTDPTGGATHWVSPHGLPAYARQRGRYARTVGTARNRAFPLWARANNDRAVPAMQRAGQLAANYQEITATGVPAEDFLFYRGVR